MLTTQKEQDVRWAKHFQEVLNRPPPEEQATITEAENDLEIFITPPGKNEIISAIKHLRNGKAPGKDYLNAELFKADPSTAAEILQPQFNLILARKFQMIGPKAQ